MAGFVIGLGLMMRDGIGKLGRDILIQCAAQRRIEELQAAANAEYGHIQRYRLVEKLSFGFVAFEGGDAAFRKAILAVDCGADILSAGKEYTVAQTDEMVDIRVFTVDGQYDGQPAARRTPSI
jgi:hypothetical protein